MAASIVDCVTRKENVRKNACLSVWQILNVGAIFLRFWEPACVVVTATVTHDSSSSAQLHARTSPRPFRSRPFRNCRRRHTFFLFNEKLSTRSVVQMVALATCVRSACCSSHRATQEQEQEQQQQLPTQWTSLLSKHLANNLLATMNGHPGLSLMCARGRVMAGS
jgi:hypothetical protein